MEATERMESGELAELAVERGEDAPSEEMLSSRAATIEPPRRRAEVRSVVSIMGSAAGFTGAALM